MLLFFHSLKFNYIFHLQSNLKSKDVVLKQIAAGSMTVPGTFLQKQTSRSQEEAVSVRRQSVK